MTKETLNHTDSKGLKIFARTFINHKESHLHQIKNLIISKQSDFYAVVNKETLKIIPFDDEESALNHALDYYKNLGVSQSELF